MLPGDLLIWGKVGKEMWFSSVCLCVQRNAAGRARYMLTSAFQNERLKKLFKVFFPKPFKLPANWKILRVIRGFLLKNGDVN